MANDPNRDLLPVKEESWKVGKGIYDKFDYQLLGKLSRCELEDRFITLLDEQTHIKKLANSQEEKIKRLGTKLLRLLNERKIGKKVLGQIKTTEDLELRVIELEHENYALKDKNTVLKQQLSSHTRHPLNHRSPLRSNYTSPLMTTRQSVQPPNSEVGYDATNKSATNEMQLQEAEAHINELNEEIKSLHDKIDFLQKNLERSSLDNRKVKVTENIELIRLQRSLKQQAIQIASLQAQVKSSESSQKVLKEELIKAHKENDDALHLISIKQNEILSLCCKLEEKNLNRLEEDELKGRIDDLMKERDCLRERSEILMKSIGAKNSETQRVSELQKLLSAEKLQKEKLEEKLELSRKSSRKSTGAESLKNDMTDSVRTVFKDCSQQTSKYGDKVSQKVGTIVIETSGPGFLCNRCNFSPTICKCSRENVLCPEVEMESGTTSDSACEKEYRPRCSTSSSECEAEKMKMKCELQYLRGMLRNQTIRCEAQQAEISRLMCELKLNEEKCNETLKNLDFHLRIFQCLEMQDREKGRQLLEEKQALPAKEFDRSSTVSEVSEKGHRQKTVIQEPIQASSSLEEKGSTQQTKFVSVKTQTVSDGDNKDQSTQTDKPLMKDFGMFANLQKTSKDRESRDADLYATSTREFPVGKRKTSFSEETLMSRTNMLPKKAILVDVEKAARFSDTEPRKRFVEQKFLDSSDEDQKVDETFKRDSFLSKVKSLDEDQPLKQKELRHDDESEESDAQIRSNLSIKKKNPAHKSTSLTPIKKDNEESVSVTVKWLKLEEGTSLWRNNEADMLFVDFTFLDLKGEETETPQSLRKPVSPQDVCQFNFTKNIPLTANRKKSLTSLLKSPEEDAIVFKVVSDSEKFDETNGECEDVGVANVTVKDFLQVCNNGPFQLKVKSIADRKEILGILCVNIEATTTLLNAKK